MKPTQLTALQAIDRAIAAYPPSVQAHVLEGVVVAALDTLNGVDASRWRVGQQTKLDEDAGLLALCDTRAQLTALRAQYADYGVRVGDLVAEC